jgi:hypothetical protein
MGTLVDKLEYLNGTKQAIKQAIKNKGVAVSNADTFRSYAGRISSITIDQGNSNDVTIERLIFNSDEFPLLDGVVNPSNLYVIGNHLLSIYQNNKIVELYIDPEENKLKERELYSYVSGTGLECKLIPGGALISGTAPGLYFYDQEANTVTEILDTDKTRINVASMEFEHIENTDYYLLYGPDARGGVIKYNAITHEAIDLTPSSISPSMTKLAVFNDMHIFITSNNSDSGNNGVVIYDSVTDTHYEYMSGSMINPYVGISQNLIDGICVVYGTNQNYSSIVVIDVRDNDHRNVSFNVGRSTFYGPINVAEITGGFFLYGTASTGIGLFYYNNTTQTLTDIYQTSYNYSNVIDVVTGVILSSASTNSGILYFKYATLTLTQIYNTGYNWTQVTKYSNYVLITGGSTRVGLGAIYYNVGTDVSTTLTTTGSFDQSQQATYGVFCYSINSSSLDQQKGIGYFAYNNQTWTSLKTSAHYLNVQNFGTGTNTGVLVSSNTSISDFAGVWIFRASNATFTQSNLTTGYAWKFRLVENTNYVLMSSTNSSYTGVYKFAPFTVTASAIVSTGFNWLANSHYAPYNSTYGQLLFSSNSSTSLGLYAFNSYNQTLTQLWSIGYNWNTFTSVSTQLNLVSSINNNGVGVYNVVLTSTSSVTSYQVVTSGYGYLYHVPYVNSNNVVMGLAVSSSVYSGIWIIPINQQTAVTTLSGSTPRTNFTSVITSKNKNNQYFQIFTSNQTNWNSVILNNNGTFSVLALGYTTWKMDCSIDLTTPGGEKGLLLYSSSTNLPSLWFDNESKTILDRTVISSYNFVKEKEFPSGALITSSHGDILFVHYPTNSIADMTVRELTPEPTTTNLPINVLYESGPDTSDVDYRFICYVNTSYAILEYNNVDKDLITKFTANTPYTVTLPVNDQGDYVLYDTIRSNDYTTDLKLWIDSDKEFKQATIGAVDITSLIGSDYKSIDRDGIRYYYADDIAYLYRLDLTTLDFTIVDSKLKVVHAVHLPHLHNEILCFSPKSVSKLDTEDNSSILIFANNNEFTGEDDTDHLLYPVFIDYTEENGFGLIASKEGYPVYDYPSLGLLKIEAGPTLLTDDSYRYVENGYTISDNIVYNHTSKILTYLSSRIDRTSYRAVPNHFTLIHSELNKHFYLFKIRA